jgi:exopolysaccharide biosynthesis predicted pyruvyltransferase EpsI
LGVAEATGLSFRPGNIDIGAIPGGREVQIEADIATPRLIVTDWYRTQFPHIQMRVRFGTLSFDTRSQFWLDAARRVLSTGRVVVSDRLHGHILSELAGVPHVLLNNSYGKNISYFETWSRPSRLCRLAHGPVHAWELAQEVLEEVRSAGAAG